MGADMPKQFRHETLAEPHDLIVRLPLGLKSDPPLAPAHPQGGEAVFENLFKGEKFHDAQVDRRMKTQAALVGSDGAVHLNPETPVDMDLSLVVHPRYPEHYDAFRLDNSFQHRCPAVFRIAVQDRFYRLKHLFNRLVEFLLSGILFLDLFYKIIHGFCSCSTATFMLRDAELFIFKHDAL